MVAGTKTEPNGAKKTGRVVIRCTSEGATLQPVEEAHPRSEAGCRDLRQVDVAVDEPGQDDERSQVDDLGGVGPRG